MGLITTLSEPLIAETDIECYKSVRANEDSEEVLSAYRDYMLYPNDNENPLIITPSSTDSGVSSDWTGKIFDVGGGFLHGFCDTNNAYYRASQTAYDIISVTIPEGTLYYPSVSMSSVCAENFRLNLEDDKIKFVNYSEVPSEPNNIIVDSVFETFAYDNSNNFIVNNNGTFEAVPVSEYETVSAEDIVGISTTDPVNGVYKFIGVYDFLAQWCYDNNVGYDITNISKTKQNLFNNTTSGVVNTRVIGTDNEHYPAFNILQALNDKYNGDIEWYIPSYLEMYYKMIMLTGLNSAFAKINAISDESSAKIPLMKEYYTYWTSDISDPYNVWSVCTQKIEPLKAAPTLYNIIRPFGRVTIS